MRHLPLLIALALAAPAAAQPVVRAAAQPEWRQAAEHQVLLRPNVFEPEEIRLTAGVPTRLVFHNNSRTAMSLTAENFFEAARIRSGDDRLIEDGGMVLQAGETKAVTLVPAPGRYRMRSQNWLRRLIGMSALIVVEPSPGYASN